MEAASVPTPLRRVTPSQASQRSWSDPAYQAFVLLRVAFTAAPILFGLDKFFNVMVHWEKYLASWINDVMPGNAFTGMHIVGGVEIAAALLVLVKPRYGAYVVAGWLAGIILDLLTLSGYYDVALRDFGLMLGALALARLSERFSGRGW